MSESFFFHSPVKVFVEKDPYEVLSDFLSDSCRIGVVSGKVAILKTGFKEFLLKSFPDKEFFFMMISVKILGSMKLSKVVDS